MLDGSRLWVVSHSGGSRYHVRADVVQFQGSMVIFSRINVQGATRVVMAVHAPTFIYELVDWKPQKPQRPAGFTPREIRK